MVVGNKSVSVLDYLIFQLYDKKQKTRRNSDNEYKIQILHSLFNVNYFGLYGYFDAADGLP